MIRVVDRGPGIPPGQLEQVFQPFYRSTAPADHGGSGLGLAIARGFTEANGGTLHVESLPGQGATFVFELPLASRGRGARAAADERPATRTHRRRAARRRRERERDGAAGRPARVLVVDDEPQILRALKVVLRDAGFEAVAAENASEALDIASLRPPQAAIVDLVLPGEDGVALTRRLREWSEMPILVLSAVGEEEEGTGAGGWG